jgi:thiamine phosphate synthase YjbQ (UPF0047 family)
MRNHSETRTFTTSGRFGVADLTPAVEEVLASSGIRAGHVTICTSEPGCALIVNEKETGLIADIKEAAGRLGNGAATPPLGSASVMLPAVDGGLCLGQWQRVLLVGLDSESSRNVVVQIVGD